MRERGTLGAYVLLGGMLLLVAGPWLLPAHGDGDGEKDIRAIKKMMKGWARGLGVKCNHCHVREGKEFLFERPTLNKTVAHHCEEEFLEELQAKDEGAITCATCHQRQVRFLPRPEDLEEELSRTQRKTVSDYCRDKFVKEMRTQSGRKINCATCHGEEVGRFLPRTIQEEDDDHDDDEDHDDDVDDGYPDD